MKKISLYIYIVFISIILNFGIANAENMYKVLPRPDVYNKLYKIDNKVPDAIPQYIEDSFNRNTKKFKEDLQSVNNVEKVLVIPLEFDDVKFKEENTRDKYDELMQEVKNYYEINSNYEPKKRGMTIEYTITDKVTSKYSMEYYATASLTDLEESEVAVIGDMAKEAVEILKEKNISLREFDNNNDGVIDHILIIHAGKGQEETLDLSNIWSHRFEIQNNGVELGDVRALNYTTVPENARVGTIIHELGHDFGLPDLYDIHNTNQGVGLWDVMGSGSWNCLQEQEPGECPSNLSAWSRELLGWADIEEVNESKTLLFRNNNGISNIYKIYLRDKYGNKDTSEYYLLEYRRRLKFDEALPEEGILIWHIDEKVISKTFFTNEVNADNAKMGIELVQADGKFHLNNLINSNRGDSGDPFPGDTRNNIFGAFLYGLNYGNNGQYSFIEGRNFNLNGDIATVDINIDIKEPQGYINTYAPLDDSNVSGDITFSCDLVPKCSEYKLQISKDKEFTRPIQYTIKDYHNVKIIDDKIVFKVDVRDDLDDNTKYYWRISAINPASKLSNVSWSLVKSINYTKNKNVDAPGNFNWEITKTVINIDWVQEDNAIGYIVLCDGKEKYVSSNRCQIDNMNKKHVIKVRSISETSSSNYEDDVLIDTTKLPYIEAKVEKEDTTLPNKIILNINNGEFKEKRNYNKATVKIDKNTLPKEIKQGNVRWISSNEVDINLVRDDTAILDEDVELTIKVSKYLINCDCDKDMEANITIKANNKNYKNEVKFSFSGLNKNRLMHIKKGMEYSLNCGLTYNICTENDLLLTKEELNTLDDEKEIIIKGNNNYFQVINLIDNKSKPPIIKNVTTKKVERLTKDMEYSFDKISWSDDISNMPEIEKSIWVRYKGVGRIKPGESIEYTFS